MDCLKFGVVTTYDSLLTHFKQSISMQQPKHRNHSGPPKYQSEPESHHYSAQSNSNSIWYTHILQVQITSNYSCHVAHVQPLFGSETLADSMVITVSASSDASCDNLTGSNRSICFAMSLRLSLPSMCIRRSIRGPNINAM